MLPNVPFYIIRHGESVANVGRYASGHVDVELTELGLEQARKAAKVVATLEVKPTIIIHSHLQRARITAQIINEGLNLPMIEDREIAEQMYGDWEGVTWDHTREPIREGIDPPNGEKHVDFHQRVKRAITKYVSGHEGPVLIVCHGGIFRAIGALYGEKITGIENCSLHHFAPDETLQPMPWKISRF